MWLVHVLDPGVLRRTSISQRSEVVDVAQRDAKRLRSSGLKPNTEEPLAALADNPYRKPPPFEKLVGDLTGAYSRRINIHHRLVYQVLDEERVIKVLRMWSHYE